MKHRFTATVSRRPFHGDRFTATVFTATDSRRGNTVFHGWPGLAQTGQAAHTFKGLRHCETALLLESLDRIRFSANEQDDGRFDIDGALHEPFETALRDLLEERLASLKSVAAQTPHSGSRICPSSIDLMRLTGDGQRVLPNMSMKTAVARWKQLCITVRSRPPARYWTMCR